MLLKRRLKSIIERKDIESKLFVLKFPKLGKDESYQYLLGMPIYSLTFERFKN